MKVKVWLHLITAVFRVHQLLLTSIWQFLSKIPSPFHSVSFKRKMMILYDENTVFKDFDLLLTVCV